MALDRNQFKIMGSALDVARMWPEKDHPLEVGDSIQGEYVEKIEHFGANESTVYVLDVRTENTGERVGVWGSAVIDENMKNVEIGTMVGFEFAGMRQSKRGNEYKDFRVGIANGVVDERLAEPSDASSGSAGEEIPF